MNMLVKVEIYFNEFNKSLLNLECKKIKLL